MLLVTRDIDAVFVCTHHPKATYSGFRQECICRKPRPGLITSSMRHFGIAPSKSIFVGDRITDIYAADSAGIMSSFLLENQQMFAVNQILDFDYHMHSPFFKFLPSLESVATKTQFASGNKFVLYLSAGFGTRLKPLTDSTPKPLLEIQGETILKRLIDGVEKNLKNVSHVVNISHLPSSFSRLQKSLGSEIDLTFSYEKTPIGSSKTLLNLAKSTDFQCNILVFHADLALSDKYFHELFSWFEQNLGSWVIGHLRPGHSARSTIEMDKNNFVNSFSNTIGHGESLQIVNSGIYFFSSEDLKIISRYDLHGEISDEILPILVKEQKLKCKVINESRLSIDHLDTLQLAQDFTF
jgi:CTP:phosphocholine cytidylyltransferase-like protein